jgi:zinc and cadmium transporter
VGISFVAGVLLGVALLHLMPHAALALKGDIDRTVGWTLGGLMLMFFVERFFSYHHHELPSEEADHAHGGRGHSHGKGRSSIPAWSWTGAAIGLGIHSLMDGVALAASTVQTTDHPQTLAGLGTFLGVALHKPFDAVAIAALMEQSGAPRRQRTIVNLLFSLLIPIGALTFRLAPAGLGGLEWTGYGLAFCSGTFLCIALSDLLPELQFHHHDRGKLSAALIAGLAIAWATGLVEGPGHGH